MAGHDVLHGERSLEDAPRPVTVTLLAEVDHRRPGCGDEAAGPTPRYAGRSVGATLPVGLHEVVMPPHGGVTPGENRGALEPVAVLMRVRRNRGNAGDAEVEDGDVGVAELLAPGKDPPAQAAIDVQANSVLERDLRKVSDGIDGPVRVVRGGANDDRSVLRDV